MSALPPSHHDAEEYRPTNEAVAALLDHAATDLHAQFPGVFATETIHAVLADIYQQIAATARVHTHLTTLATRYARERLADIAKNQGAVVPTSPRSAVRLRPQRRALPDGRRAAAPPRPGQGHRPLRRVRTRRHRQSRRREVMNELGLDLSQEFPKKLSTDAVQAADVVITMGCGDACPVFPGKRYLDWELTDPAGKSVDEVRKIRDELDRHIRDLLAELIPTKGGDR
ncbi:hypothetical protein GCM10025787_14800 [Saccharopolyspora rosea]